jgi:hypothetical protein
MSKLTLLSLNQTVFLNRRCTENLKKTRRRVPRLAAPDLISSFNI